MGEGIVDLGAYGVGERECQIYRKSSLYYIVVVMRLGCKEIFQKKLKKVLAL